MGNELLVISYDPSMQNRALKAERVHFAYLQ